MAAQPFTSPEWRSIGKALKARPEVFGLPERRYGSVVLGCFNIRKLGAMDKRDDATWDFLARVCARFDLLAIQEIMDDLSGMKHLMQRLGPEYGLIVSDATGAFPGEPGLAERLGFIFNKRIVRRTEIATDITYDRTRVLNTLALNRRETIEVMNRYGEYLEKLREWEAGGRQGRKPRKPSKSQLRLPAFLTFIRQPFCVGFKINGHPGTRPYEFLAVNAHLNYGDPKHDPKQEFYALMDWIVARAGQEGKPYHENFILLGDLNLDFDNPVADKARLERDIKELNQVTESGVNVNFPFLDVHPKREEIFRTNARDNQTYDQIGLFARDQRLPTYEANETLMGESPVGPDYGVFNFVDLFQEALDMPDADLKDFYPRFEHKVSDHLPLWLRLPLP